MASESQYIHGIFRAEIKNRFLCSVDINGEDNICYIPSSCRLSNFFDLTDKDVLLRPIKAQNSRTKYFVYAVKFKRTYILVKLSSVNALIESQLHRRYFSFLGKRKNTLREVMIEDYKSDLYIKDTNTLLEIKSILSLERITLFPSVYSERAILQLQAISRLLDKGYKACYLLMSLNPCVKEILLNPKNSAFCNSFLECLNKGMECRAFSLRLIDGEPELYSKIRFSAN